MTVERLLQGGVGALAKNGSLGEQKYESKPLGQVFEIMFICGSTSVLLSRDGQSRGSPAPAEVQYRPARYSSYFDAGDRFAPSGWMRKQSGTQKHGNRSGAKPKSACGLHGEP